MARPVLIVCFEDGGCVTAGAVSAKRGGKKDALLHFASRRDMSRRDALSSILDEMRRAGHEHFSDVLLGLPPSVLSLRIITLPFREEKKIEAALPFETAELFLRDGSGLVVSALPLCGEKAMAVAVEKAEIRTCLEMLAGCGLDPSWAGAALFSKPLLVGPGEDKGTVAFFDGASIAAQKDGEPCFFRTVNCGRDDFERTIACMEEHGCKPDRFVAAGQGIQALRSMGIEYREVGGMEGKTDVLALAAHFHDGMTGAVNLRKGEFERTRERDASKRGLRTAYVLAAVLAALIYVNGYVKYHGFEKEAAQTLRRVFASYGALFPNEARIIDPVLQLEARLKAIRDSREAVFGKGGGNASALDAMAELARAGKNSGVRIYELRSTRGRITVSGEAPGFDEAGKFRDSVAGGDFFRDVSMDDAKSGAGGNVSFTVSASTGGTE